MKIMFIVREDERGGVGGGGVCVVKDETHGEGALLYIRRFENDTGDEGKGSWEIIVKVG